MVRVMRSQNAWGRANAAPLQKAQAATWNEIGKLGAIAVIRTTLNFYLSREMQEERRTAEGERDVQTQANSDR